MNSNTFITEYIFYSFLVTEAVVVLGVEKQVNKHLQNLHVKRPSDQIRIVGRAMVGLKGQSHEMGLAFEDMLGQFKA